MVKNKMYNGLLSQNNFGKNEQHASLQKDHHCSDFGTKYQRNRQTLTTR